MTVNLKCEAPTVDENITMSMRATFRPVLQIKPLSSQEIKELAKDMYEHKVVNITSENIYQIGFSSILVSSFVQENDIQPKDFEFVARLDDRGVCGSMKVILRDDWNKGIKLYNKALEVFA